VVRNGSGLMPAFLPSVVTAANIADIQTWLSAFGCVVVTTTTTTTTLPTTTCTTTTTTGGNN